MTTERFALSAAVFLILVKNGRVLLGRRRHAVWYDKSYDLVSGHLDGNETLVGALTREAKEEINITIDPKDVRFTTFLHIYHPEDGKEYFNVFFEVREWQGEPTIMEPDKCDDLRWFPLDELPDNLTPGARTGLQAFMDKTVFLESGF